MADSEQVGALLQQLVSLQQEANAQQLRAIENSERHYAETRDRVEASIALQKTAVRRQQVFVRLWIGLVLLLFALRFAAYFFLAHYR